MARPISDDRQPHFSAGHDRGLRCAILILCAAITLYHAFVGRGGVFLFLDEWHSLANLDRGYAFLLSTFDTHGSGIALPLLQRFSADLIGDRLSAYRLPAALGAVGAVLLCYSAGKRMVGAVPALIASLALCSNSLFIYYSRVGRSYTLAVFFLLLVALTIHRALEAQSPRLRSFLPLALAVGLSPYIHLATAPVVAAIAAAAAATLIARGDWSSHGGGFLGSLAAGVLLAGLLHLPAFGAITSFLGGVVEGRENEFIHDWTYVWIASETLAGGRGAALLWWVGMPIASIWLLVTQRRDSFILLAAALSPLVVVLVLTPRGAPVAWSRYLLVSLPFQLMLLSWWLAELVRLLPISRLAANRLALVAGGTLVFLGFVFGPLGIEHRDDRPFSNGYLSARPIAAHDVSWPRTPTFYRKLADESGEGSIIEVPMLSNRRAYLYRNYFLQHGRGVEMGIVDASESIPDPAMPPYIPVLQEGAIRASGAEYLVLHLNVQREALAYEVFVAEIDRGKRARRAGQPAPRHGLLLTELAREWEQEWGAPFFRDESIVAWKLPPTSTSGK